MVGHVPRVKARLSLQSHRKILGLLEGEYASVRTGRGVDFNDLREYVRGDDVKDLDWKASARTGGLLVKRFVAVRRHTVLLVVSTARTMAAAHTATASKRQLAIEVAGLLGWVAVRQGDLVGVIYGDGTGRSGLPPKGGEPHLERCLDAVHDAIRSDGAPTDLVALLRFVSRTVRRRTILLVVCEEQKVTPELAAALRRLVVQHEVLMVTVGDIDPVAVSAAAPGAHDVGTDRALPAWLRGDARLGAELLASRAAAVQGFHAAVAGLGVVHEHLEPPATALSVVRRLLVRSRHARRR